MSRFRLSPCAMLPWPTMLSSNPCIYMDCGGGDHYNGRLAIRRAEKLQAEVCGDRGIGLRPRLYAGSVCDDSATEAVHAAPYKRT